MGSVRFPGKAANFINSTELGFKQKQVWPWSPRASAKRFHYDLSHGCGGSPSVLAGSGTGAPESHENAADDL